MSLGLDSYCKTCRHAYQTNRVRGLLFQACNTAIGLFDEKVERFQAAIRYLEMRQ